MAELTQTELYGIAVLISAVTAFGLLCLNHAKANTRPTWLEIVGTLIVNGSVGGALGLGAYDIKGYEKSLVRLIATSSGVGAGLIKAQEFFNRGNMQSNGQRGGGDVGPKP
jgi:hypothetical protein